MEHPENSFREKRKAHWDHVSQDHVRQPETSSGGVYYHELLNHYYRFLIPPGLRVLELGSGHGGLLAALHPCLGVGVDLSGHMVQTARKNHPELNFIQADAHHIPLKGPFDVIILSDLVNDLWDVQSVFENIRELAGPRTRIILNFFNNIWRLPLQAVQFLNLGHRVLEQNWLAPHDVFNLLKLSGFEVIKHLPCIGFPAKLPVISDLVNRFLTHIWPFKWFALTNFVIARPDSGGRADNTPVVSIIVPARNESGNIENIFQRAPGLGRKTELIFVEGHSTDNTYEKIEETMARFPDVPSRVFRQSGRGKGDAVRLGFKSAAGDILMILDADLTVPPEDLIRFFNAIASGKGEFINGVRLVYPMENQSMRFLNMVGNKFFSMAFSWLLGQPVKDTLCGTKVLWKEDYEAIARNRSYFGDFDPFGDFDLLFGAARLNLKIIDVPIRYRARTYGDTNIQRWRHGWLLIKMVIFAAKRIKFI